MSTKTGQCHYGPFPTDSQGFLGMHIINGVDYWDISVITCEAIGVPHFIGDEDEIDAGKFIGCNVCPAIPYEAYNPEEPYDP